jgi:MoxR-like ATPase
VQNGLARIDGYIAYGASPRASIGLVHAARGLALLRGRSEVEAQDIYDVAYDVLNHRLVLSFDAIASGVTVDDILVELLSTVPAPMPVAVA